MNSAKISISHAPHEGETKFYTVIAINDNDYGSIAATWLLFKIYGPDGKHGNVKVERYGNNSALLAAHADIVSKKKKRGYSFENRVVHLKFETGYIQPELDDLIETLPREHAEIITKYKTEIYNGLVEIYGSEPSVSTSSPKKVKAPPKPEPIRSADWGSW